MGKYPPGSFSKNFAWHRKGLSKLHETIRQGFKGTPIAVDRTTFLNNCGIPDPSIRLIPVNFFLHNHVDGKKNIVSVDELVFQALALPHSPEFDRLSLFTLHLSQGGARRGRNGDQHPTQWIREFVANRLWQGGYWQRDHLSLKEMDDYFSLVLDAKPDVRVKCRSNYRHILELCRINVDGAGDIDTGASGWMGSALFLAWDRYQIDSGLKSSDLSVHDLVDVSKKAQLHKLIGIPAGDLLDYVDQIGPEYLRAGAIDRFSGALESIDVPDYEPTLRGRPPKPRKVRTYRKAFILKRTEQEERSVVERRQETREVQQRDATTAANLKEMYFFRCMFCDIALTVDIDVPRYYAEAAHIQALGKPDDGPDVPENMLVLCPNHHKQFDNGVLFLTWKSASTLKLHSKIPGDVLDGKEVHLERGHTVDSQYVNHHRKKWS